MIEYQFPWPNEEKGYNLFPQNLEENENILFHGTFMRNFDSICKNGFLSADVIGKGTNPNFKLQSVSYAKNSSQCLAHVCDLRNSSEDKAVLVFMVQFESISQSRIHVNISDIHVYDPAIQPKIIGYCVVPEEYRFI